MNRITRTLQTVRTEPRRECTGSEEAPAARVLRAALRKKSSELANEALPTGLVAAPWLRAAWEATTAPAGETARAQLAIAAIEFPPCTCCVLKLRMRIELQPLLRPSRAPPSELVRNVELRMGGHVGPHPTVKILSTFKVLVCTNKKGCVLASDGGTTD
jgi:hypothetical protein